MNQPVMKKEECLSEGDNDEDYDENDDIGGADNKDTDEDDNGDKESDAIKKAPCLEQMLQLEILLSDGSTAKIFSRGPKYSKILWPISCHICLIGNISAAEMQKHIQSKMHKKMLKRSPPEPAHYIRAFRQPFGKNPACVTPLQIFPGEFITHITPDLQHRIIKRDDWNYKEIAEDKTLHDSVIEHSKKVSMMGLGYALKMKRNDRLMYFCILCRTAVHGEGYQHFTGSKHVDKYIEKHFPKFSKKLQMNLRILEPTYNSIIVSKLQKYVRWICQRIYKKIKEQMGAQHQVKFIDSYDFKINRSRYAEKVRDSEHYDEDTILISDAELKEYAKRALDAIPMPPPKMTKKQRLKLTAGLASAEKQQFGILTKSTTRRNQAKKARKQKSKAAKRGIVSPEDEKKEVTIATASSDKTMNLMATVAQKETVQSLKKETNPDLTPILQRSRKKTEDNIPPRKQQKYSHDEPVTIVSAMRLVSALENQLGSLGPLAVELLTKAILSEKNNPNSNDLLMDNEFYVFFMTAREKFKGQILARIVEPNRINAVNQTIDRITLVLDMMEEYRARNNYGERNFQHSNHDNQYSANAGLSSKNPNKYSSGNQGCLWQSGAYLADKAAYSSIRNEGNNQSISPNSNYRDINNSNNYQFGAGGSSENRQTVSIDDYSNRGDETNADSAAYNRQFNGGPTGIQMRNSGGRYIGGDSSSQPNTGYNQPNNFNNLDGQSSGMRFDIDRNSFFSRDSNSNARVDAGMDMYQNHMGNYDVDGGYNSRSTIMNSRYNRNSGRFQN